MGVTGLHAWIKKHCPDAVAKKKIDDYHHRKLSFDVDGLMYSFDYGENHDTAYLERFGDLCVEIISCGIVGLFVFDGPTVELKKHTKQERLKITENREEQIKTLMENERMLKEKGWESDKEFSEELLAEIPTEKQLYLQELLETHQKLKDLEKAAKPTAEKYTDVKDMMTLMGLYVIEAPHDNEAYCAVLNNLGIVHAVVSDDGDVIPFGGIRMVRGFTPKIKRATEMREYHIPTIISRMKISREQAPDVAILAGCDYTKEKIARIAIATAIEKIRKHHTIGRVIKSFTEKEKEKFIVPEEASFPYRRARAEFLKYVNMKDPGETLSDVIYYTSFQENILRAFLSAKLPNCTEKIEGWISVLREKYPKPTLKILYSQDEEYHRAKMKEVIAEDEYLPHKKLKS